jgi:hypothetical protein
VLKTPMLRNDADVVNKRVTSPERGVPQSRVRVSSPAHFFKSVEDSDLEPKKALFKPKNITLSRDVPRQHPLNLGYGPAKRSWLRQGHYYYSKQTQLELDLGLPVRIQVFWFSMKREGIRRPSGGHGS